MQPIPIDVIRELLKEDAPAPKYIPTPQRGPVRYTDFELRCTKLRCGSSTYIKVDGIPRCLTHALQDLNEIAIVLTDRIEELVKSRPVGDLFE